MRLRDVLAWLTINTMRAENVQAGLLAEQRAANVWRKHAYRILLERNVTIGTRNCLDETQKCLDVFRERVNLLYKTLYLKSFQRQEDYHIFVDSMSILS